VVSGKRIKGFLKRYELYKFTFYFILSLPTLHGILRRQAGHVPHRHSLHFARFI